MPVAMYIDTKKCLTETTGSHARGFFRLYRKIELPRIAGSDIIESDDEHDDNVHQDALDLINASADNDSSTAASSRTRSLRATATTTYSPRLRHDTAYGRGAQGQLILDDWAMTPLDPATRADLLEIIDDRATHKATLITTQLPVEHWHDWIGDATIADAICDRLMQRVHRLTLTGESLRDPDGTAASKKRPTKTLAAPGSS